MGRLGKPKMSCTEVNNLKSWGYVLTIPFVAAITVYFMDKSIDIQKEKNEVLKEQNEVLKQEIEFRKVTSYSGAHLELDSQKKIYERKIENINKEILNTRLELEGVKKDNDRKKKTLEKLHALLLRKEILIRETVDFLSKYLDSNESESKGSSSLEQLIEMLRLENSRKDGVIFALQLEKNNAIESIEKCTTQSKECISKCDSLHKKNSLPKFRNYFEIHLLSRFGGSSRMVRHYGSASDVHIFHADNTMEVKRIRNHRMSREFLINLKKGRNFIFIVDSDFSHDGAATEGYLRSLISNKPYEMTLGFREIPFISTIVVEQN